MIGINKRYPAYKAKMELRNRIRRAQEKELLLKLQEKNNVSGKGREKSSTNLP